MTMENSRPGARHEDLSTRIKRFALGVLRFVSALPDTPVCRVLGNQLLRSGTSVGANHREGTCARSTAEFIAKFGIAQFEAAESGYWLELFMEGNIANTPEAKALWQESNEIKAILGASIVTAGRRKK